MLAEGVGLMALLLVAPNTSLGPGRAPQSPPSHHPSLGTRAFIPAPGTGTWQCPQTQQRGGDTLLQMPPLGTLPAPW